jgi:hypothetical protein
MTEISKPAAGPLAALKKTVPGISMKARERRALKVFYYKTCPHATLKPTFRRNFVAKMTGPQ